MGLMQTVGGNGKKDAGPTVKSGCVNDFKWTMGLRPESSPLGHPRPTSPHP